MCDVVYVLVKRYNTISIGMKNHMSDIKEVGNDIDTVVRQFAIWWVSHDFIENDFGGKNLLPNKNNTGMYY